LIERERSYTFSYEKILTSRQALLPTLFAYKREIAAHFLGKEELRQRFHPRKRRGGNTLFFHSGLGKREVKGRRVDG